MNIKQYVIEMVSSIALVMAITVCNSAEAQLTQMMSVDELGVSHDSSKGRKDNWDVSGIPALPAQTGKTEGSKSVLPT